MDWHPNCTLTSVSLIGMALMSSFLTVKHSEREHMGGVM